MNQFDITKINILPNEIIINIKEYIPYTGLLVLNKNFYFKHHKYFKKLIKEKLYENYIRDIVRKDYYFVFDLLIKENYKFWYHVKRYIYKNVIYGNYICFLQSYCIENESTNCRNLLNKFLNESGLSKNQHKKNTIKNIRWRI